MEMNPDIKPKYLYIAAGVLLALVLFFSINYFVQKSQMTKIVTQMTDDKESLESEYNGLLLNLDSLTSDNNRINLNNDSLFNQLESQQHKISQLMDQLKTVKATDTQKINEYRAQLADMREVLKSYVKQIDELNSENKKLKQENFTYKQKQAVATTQITTLSQEKEKLTSVVNIASTLHASNIVIEPLTSRDNKARRIAKVAKVKFSFSIAANVTATPGNKKIYLRVLKPDGEAANVQPGNVFDFENAKVDYTAERDIEYGGVELPTFIVWNVNEILFAGQYNALFIIDGKKIGEASFTLK